LPCCVDEDRAAAAGDARPRIVVNLDDKIIEIIYTCQPIGTCIRWHLDRSIIMAIGRVFAPTVRRGYPLCRKGCCWSRMPVGPPPKPPEPETAPRCTAVAFAFVRLDSATPERHWQSQHSCHEPATACVTRLAPYCNAGQGSFLHRCNLALFGPKYQFPLALLALNVLFRDCRRGRAGVL
jgi:hypothetical protein